MKRLFAVATIVGALAAAAPATANAACPVGHSQMGCSLPPVLKGLSTPPLGEIMPDVSSYQGTVNWAEVKAWQTSHGWRIPGGIFKLGENVMDPYAAQNSTALRNLHMAAIGYVFVRPGLQASTVIEWAHAAEIKVVVLDEEVPGIYGTAARVTPALRGAGLTVVDYHSAGENFDATAQELDCWVADYGPSTPPACTTGPRVAWQFTQYGSVPGVNGTVDESVSYGLLKLAAPPVKLVCFGKGATPRVSKCQAALKLYDRLITAHRFWQHEFGRCIRYADGIGCSSALREDERAGVEAARLRKRYTA